MTRRPGPAPVRVLGVVVLLLVGTALAMSIGVPDVDGVQARLDEAGPARWLVLVAGVAVALLTPVSRSALSLLVGAVAGFPAGLAVALSGGILGGVAGFALSRRLGREAVARRAGARLARLDRAVSDRGLVAVLVARLMPVAPFVLVSYAAGLSGIRLGPYLVGTAIGIVPWSVLYVGIGASAAGIDSWTSLVDIAPMLAILALPALVIGHLWWRGQRCSPSRGLTPRVSDAGSSVTKTTVTRSWSSAGRARRGGRADVRAARAAAEQCRDASGVRLQVEGTPVGVGQHQLRDGSLVGRRGAAGQGQQTAEAPVTRRTALIPRTGP